MGKDWSGRRGAEPLAVLQPALSRQQQHTQSTLGWGVLDATPLPHGPREPLERAEQEGQVKPAAIDLFRLF